MEYNIVVKPDAELELSEAMDWYDKQGQGLAEQLLSEVSDVFEDIVKNPEYYQKQYRSIRIRFTQKFRYGIHYTVEGNIIYVHAILHTSRRPRE